MPRTAAAPTFVILLLLLSGSSARAEAPAWATYTAVFDATWSAETHPESFPAAAHWSGLIGGTHDAAASFWAPGELATTGIKQMAEWGAQTVLAQEIEDQIAAGHAGVVIAADPLWESPGQASVSFTIGVDHPLVTLVTMIAPSPDWFAGVRGLNLLDGQTWRDEVVVQLYPHDAGTDSGATYTAPDLATVPPEPISSITGAPFTPGVPVATLTFRLDQVASATPPPARPALRAVPNPFNPRTELRFSVPENAREVDLTVLDVRGRVVRVLAVGPAAGERRIAWDGRSGDGRAVPSGVYFARLAVDGVVTRHKLTLVQ
jgi:hypothetical protein